ncbi:MAG: C45 family autoproteolytic acyltransferase/hydrolase [Clostridia bacterium]|jgi:predicted choloylglycine hydrolase|nr:C45 family autoproteolytic acyltransferase/hydrolase [Clostridia bacterium]MCI1999428.1 C45 family autoproteolytic acyltransferase/hydrolase [Clostridia bacterium]MCI2015070.1 C45 family autoproteolytic acyltransferase/hydrolase [Clostridia bacterium]
MYHKRFTGTHYEAGYKFGKKLSEYGVSLGYCPTYEIDESRKSFAEKCKEQYKVYYPEILDEIKGISDGQNLDSSIIETILLTMYCMNFDNKCTCMAYKNGEDIVFARNSDFLVNIEKLNLNCIYKLDNSFAFNGNTTAYTQMEDGINEYGLAAGLTFVFPKLSKPGINAGMIIRYILEKCKTTKEALEFIKNVPKASSQTITIADASGDLAVAECNYEKTVIIRPEDKNFVAAANCFVSEEMKKYNETKIDNWRAEERYNTAYNALNEHSNELSVKLMGDILSGKYGFMCQYDRKKNADTVWSVIYDIKNKKIFRAEGNPSRKKYKEDTRMKFI